MNKAYKHEMKTRMGNIEYDTNTAFCQTNRHLKSNKLSIYTNGIF